MQDTINIVEPTLTDQAGHCYSFIASFCRASADAGVHLRLWAGRNAAITLTEKNVRVYKHFHSKIRRLQSFLLFRKLMNEPGKLFVSTAVFSDLVLLKWAIRKTIPETKAYFYFHWINASARKRAFLKRLAQQQPNLVIMGPTASVIEIFKEAGFKNAHIVPYPISGLVINDHADHDRFEALLYAGAARQDKGISQVVDVVEHMNGLKLEIPVRLQVSPDHRGKYDAATKADIERLERTGYSALQLFPETLDADEYARLFAGAICIQLYNAKDFADRISGVTLDALSAGSPIITTAGTWIARMVQRFDAGLVVDSTNPETILAAIRKIIAEYPQYNKNAYQAGLALQQENSAGILFRTVAA